MYMYFEDGLFKGLYATYEDAINPNIQPIITEDGNRGLPHPKVEAEKYSGIEEFTHLWNVKPVHEPHYI